MKQEYKISMKLFAFVMALLMLLVSLPIAAFANAINENTNETNTSVNDESKAEKKDVIVLEEDETLRDENVKHFKLSDGTTKAVVYSQAVHYKDTDGKWVDINNALNLNGSEYSSNNKQSIKLANKSGSNGLVSIKDGDYKIDFTPLNTNKVRVGIENPQTNNSRKFEDMSQLNNLVSKAIYKNIYDGVDIEYVLVGNNLKENIIVNEIQDSYTFTFELKLNKLSAELKDGAIILSDCDTGEKVYEIPAPYMLDANNEYSNSVEYSLIQNNKWKYTFTVTANPEWINAQERAFPVTIDPMVYTNSNITDTFIGADNGNYGTFSNLILGDFYSLDSYAFIKFNSLPTIPEGAIVTNATLNAYAYHNNGTLDITVGAFRITNSWTSLTTHATGLTYFNVNRPIDCILIDSLGHQEWDITSLFKLWQSGTMTNNGIALKALDMGELQGKSVFLASADNIDYSVPQLEVSYTTIDGIENYYSYYQSSADMAGTGYVNAFTGNLTFVHNIFTTADEIMPFNLFTTYNCSTKKWILNIDETIESVTLNGIQHYKWIDGDGTEHWFAPYMQKNDAGNYVFYQFNEDGTTAEVTTPTEFYDQSGLGLKLTVSNGKIYISDDKGNKKEFTNGKLSKIEDTYGNSRTFVTTGTQTKIYLQPNGLENPILQLIISEYDTDIIIDNMQTGITACVINYNLIDHIAYVLDDETHYTVNFSYSNGYLVQAKNSKNNKGIQYNYTGGKVTKVTEIANANSQTVTNGNAMSISYGTMTTTSRAAGADNILNNSDDIYSTYRFDNSGRVITAYSHDSDNNIYNSSSYQYNDMYKEDNIGPKLHNSLKTSFVNGSSTPNYLYNGAFETGITGWITGGGGNVLVDVYDGYDTLDAIDYGRSLKMQSTASNTSTAEQSVYLTVGTYTLSASLYKEKMLEDSSIVIEIYNSSNTKIAFTRSIKKEDSVYAFNDWEKETLTFDVSVAGNYTVIFKYNECASPTVLNYICIDDAMLERSTGNGTFSAYGNGSFEKNLWSNSEQNNAISVSTQNALQGSSVLQLTSSLTNGAYYKETYNVCGNYYTSDHFVISAWAKAEALPSSNKSNSNATFGIELRTYYQNYNSVGVLFVPFEADCTDWQYVSKAVSLAPLDNDGISGGNLEKIEIYIRYDYNKGSAYFDNVCFARSGSLTTYSYNSLGYVERIGDSSGKFTEYNYNSQCAYELTSISDQNGVTSSVDYDENHNVESTTYNGTDVDDTTDDITTDYTRNDFGQITQNLTTHTNSQLKLKNNTTYVTDTTKSYFSRVSTTTDQKGMITEYYYNDKGQLEKIYYNNESGIQYQYNVYGQLTCAIPLVYNSNQNKYVYNEYSMTQVEYEYNENTLNLDKIDANTDYSFEYDEFGNMTSFKINGIEIASYEYIQNNGNLKKLDYGNDYYVEYSYDSLDRIIAVCYNGIERTVYTYTPNGQVYEVTDLENGIKYKYSYDGKGVILNERATVNGITHYNKSYDYDDQGRLTEKRIALSDNGVRNNSYRIIYRYDDEGRIKQTENVHLDLINTYSYDLMGNLNKDTLESLYGGVFIEKEYEFEIVNFEYLTGNISLATEYINGKEYRTEYTYDIKGNITQITYRCVTDNDVKYVYYEYDKYNQLSREDNQLTGYTYEFYYDWGGNLRSRDVWNYEVGEISQQFPVYYEMFFYDNSAWQDQITGYEKWIPYQMEPTFEGTFTYDPIGNPLTYYNGTTYSLTWQNGRQLAEVELNGIEYTYKYNQDGIRLSKSYGNTLVEYIVDGTQIICERTYNTSTNRLTSATVYSYDANGTPNGAKVSIYNGTSEPTTYTFFFRTNLQGDVLAIYDKSTKQQVVSFNYNAWGDYTTNVHNTTLSQIALNYTHLRYRGYYQDVETEFYYLNSRYYDSKMCKFLNADSYVSTGQGFVGFNMYAYCSNNPVMYVDPTGDVPVLIILAIAFVAVMCIDTAIYCGTSISNHKHNSNLESTEKSTQNTIIDDQEDYDDFQYGFFDVGYNGCEAIAVHNAKVILGYDSSLSDAIITCQINNGMVLYGTFGTNPYAIGDVLCSYGISYDVVGTQQLSTPGVYIISYWTKPWDDGFRRIHTVAVDNRNGTTRTYNGGNVQFDGSQDVIYITGYYLGG